MLEVYAAQEADRLSQQQFILQQAMSERLQQQFTVGEITRAELIRSQLALNQQQINLSTSQKRSAESRVLLATAIGVPVAALTGLEFNFSPLVHPPDFNVIPIATLRETALQKRPDILATLADYAAAQSALQLEIANQYPNIQANPGYTWDIGSHYWTLAAAALSVPIFHQNQGLIAEAEAKRHELAVRFEALQLRILGDIDRAHAGLAALRAKWLVAEQQMRLQQQNQQLAVALFQAGETDQLALLGTKLENTLAERSRLDVLVETQQALNALEDTLRYPLVSKLPATLTPYLASRKTSQ